MKNKIRPFLYGILIAIGSLQMIGYVFQSKMVRGLGTVTAASPLPIVFTSVNGIETFASTFKLNYSTEEGKTDSLEITPEIYSKFQGPYNRKNIYGAVFAYGPLLPENLRNTILQRAFCNPGYLKDDLAIKGTLKSAEIKIATKTKGENNQWVFQMNCEK